MDKLAEGLGNPLKLGSCWAGLQSPGVQNEGRDLSAGKAVRPGVPLTSHRVFPLVPWGQGR